ncbi:hypothetical protein [Endozoicomonas sp. 8E]|uniref:hypothetical protein n=1 Tax=Endozoicomonas sp. 8E TaxID=3035692 RepID=UPI00293943C3|nr:hypothetical protein [Endozoicomonas sp. 8E]WOG27769.1 hypothetical protein P6910_25015 [Endozoicomonas sp. 8E]
MHPYFIHQSRWLFLSFLLFSLQVSATPCKNCGKERTPGKDGQMFCQTCDSGKSASPPDGPSSGKAAGATNDETAATPELDPTTYSLFFVKDEDALMTQVLISEASLAAAEEEGGDAFVKAFAKRVVRNLVDTARNMNVSHMVVRTDKWDKQIKQVEMMQKVRQAQLSAGAEKTNKVPIHEKAKALTIERGMKMDPSQWPDLSDLGMTHLLSVEFQNSPPVIDLTSVFQAIQEGNMIQLFITKTLAADEGNQAAARTVTTMLGGSIIPDPAMDGNAESTAMHLLTGLVPLRVNQQNLMNVLMATMEIIAENAHNADLSLHFFLSPPINIQDNEDPLLLTPDIDYMKLLTEAVPHSV